MYQIPCLRLSNAVAWSLTTNASIRPWWIVVLKVIDQFKHYTLRSYVMGVTFLGNRLFTFAIRTILCSEACPACLKPKSPFSQKLKSCTHHNAWASQHDIPFWIKILSLTIKSELICCSLSKNVQTRLQAMLFAQDTYVVHDTINSRDDNEPRYSQKLVSHRPHRVLRYIALHYWKHVFSHSPPKQINKFNTQTQVYDIVYLSITNTQCIWSAYTPRNKYKCMPL